VGWLALAGLCCTVALADKRPIRSELEETARARLHAERVRIQPRKGAAPGACREIDADDLIVVYRRERVRDAARVSLERRWRPTIHALVLDTSGSMASDLPYAQQAAIDYIRQLRPASDRALLTTFDESVALRQGVTADQDRLVAAVENIRMGEQTSMHDAMVHTMRVLDSHSDRPVLILLSDGEDTISFHDEEDVVLEAQSRPDLTIFTIGIGLRLADVEGSTKRLLQRLARASNGKFFEIVEGSSLQDVFFEIRDILESEATVSVVDPSPTAKPGWMHVQSSDPDCRVAHLRGDNPAEWDRRRPEPIKRPYSDPPRRITIDESPVFFKLFEESSRVSVDPLCRAGARKQFVQVDAGRVSGCGLDMVLEHGPLYDVAEDRMTVHNARPAVRTRPFSMSTPPLEKLPNRPEELMDDLAARAILLDSKRLDVVRRPLEQHARPYYDHPALAHGTVFLELRPRLALALFHQPEYRSWAQEKVRQDTERELRAWARRFRRWAPGLDDTRLAAAVRDTEAAQQILERGERPTVRDLLPYLAAWLGDISANELFSRWESLRINRKLYGERDSSYEGFALGWRSLRQIFFVPSYARVLSVLSPVYDLDRDSIGFWRVLLPKPSRLERRTRTGAPGDRVPLDLVPDLPLGYWIAEQALDADPELARRLREAGYRVTGVHYTLRGKPKSRDPHLAFHHAAVEVRFEAPAGRERPVPHRLVLAADLTLQETRRRIRRTVQRPAAPVPATQPPPATTGAEPAPAKPSASQVSLDDAWNRLTAPRTAGDVWNQLQGGRPVGEPEPPGPAAVEEPKKPGPAAAKPAPQDDVTVVVRLEPRLESLEIESPDDPEIAERVAALRDALQSRSRKAGGAQ
jgi:Mg-chelatase subunit ChlD